MLLCSDSLGFLDFQKQNVYVNSCVSVPVLQYNSDISKTSTKFCTIVGVSNEGCFVHKP